MEQALALLVICLTILAFWKNDAVLYMLGVISWLFMTFYLANLTYPAGNVYLPYAATGFSLAVVLVMAIQAIRVFYSVRDRPPTSRDIQAEHRRKVLGLTKRKERPWYEE